MADMDADPDEIQIVKDKPAADVVDLLSDDTRPGAAAGAAPGEKRKGNWLQQFQKPIAKKVAHAAKPPTASLKMRKNYGIPSDHAFQVGLCVKVVKVLRVGRKLILIMPPTCTHFRISSRIFVTQLSRL